MTQTPVQWLAPITANTTDMGSLGNTQNNSEVIGLANGNFLVVWESNQFSGLGPYGRLFDPLGVPLGDEFALTAAGSSPRADLSIAPTADGGFLASYTRKDPTNDDVFTLEFDADGNSVQLGIIANSSTHNESQSAITVLLDGSYVVAYQDDANANGATEIRARIVATDGTRGTEFTVLDIPPPTGDQDQRGVELTTLKNGNFVAIFEDDFNASDTDVRARIFQPDGTPVAGSFLISNSGSNIDETLPDIVALEGGGFVATWERSDNNEIHYEVYNSAGTLVSGANLVANTDASNDTVTPRLTALDDGGFAMVWQIAGVIKGQVFDNLGAKVGLEFIVDIPGLVAFDPSIATTSDGRLVISATVTDMGNEDVHVAIYDPRDVVINGTGLGETIVASVAGSIIDGKAGNDVLIGSETADSLDGGSGIDTLRGNGGTDELFGGKGDDFLFGGANNDTLNGGAGADFLDGGAGTNTLSYTGSASSVDINLATGTAFFGDAQGDTFFNIQNVIGSDLNDAFAASDVANHFDGRDGSSDVVDYSGAATGIGARLNGQPNWGAQAAGDTYVNIENLRGSNHNDQLVGDGQNNRLEGLDGADNIFGSGGNDTLIGGLGGDGLNGGQGTDTASYMYSLTGVGANLMGGANWGAQAVGDTYDSIENLHGSLHNDQLVGDNGNNVLEGWNGNDVIWGLGGIDTLIGGAHNDTLIGGLGGDTNDGGSGNDTASYQAAASAVGARLDGGPNWGADAAGDSYISIENLRGSNHNDQLVGNGQNNVLEGLDGADNIFGSGGNDTLIGGLGGDNLNGGQGVDTASYETADSAVGARLGMANWGAHAAGDSYTGIENLRGSAQGDQLVGDGAGNVLEGLGGGDMIFGGGGSDTLIGGAGDDGLNGGLGADTFLFDDGFGDDTISDFVSGSDRVDLTLVALISGFGNIVQSTNGSGDAVAGIGADSITFTGLTWGAGIVSGDFDI